MLRYLTSGLLTLCLTSASAENPPGQSVNPERPSPKEALEWMVLKEINSAYFTRDEPMERSALVEQVPLGVIKEVDISHDGIVDWLVDYTNSGLTYCGTGGCLRTLYVSAPDNRYVKAFDDQSEDFVIRQRGTETVIDMTVHPVMCSPVKNDCAYSFAWDSRLERLVERPNARGEALLSSDFALLASPEEDEPRPPEVAPESLKSQWRKTAVACPSYATEGAFEVRHAKVLSIPDLDGDDVRDWSYEPTTGCTPEGGMAGDIGNFLIYLSRGDADVELAFTSERGEHPVYDIATSPALLISNPDCGYDVACRNQPLRWDAATKEFVPNDR